MTTSAIDLRCGDWRVALAGVAEVDALITDTPYSERTHVGHDEGVAGARLLGKRRAITYGFWTPADVEQFVAAWSPRVHGWIVTLTDHILEPVWSSALAANGRYVFAPLHFMAPGSRVRLVGDGPSCWSITIVVARPMTRKYARWGSLPGGYVLPRLHNDRCNDPESVTGGKPLWLMRALVRDYSRPGDLVCDPCAGGATTLIAAATEGRRGIGAELDPVTFAKAQKRIARGYTPTLFDTSSQPMAAAAQAGLFEGDE